MISLGDSPGVARRVASSREAGYNLAFSWFPSDEWSKAIERWPDLLEERPSDPLEYNRVLESVMKQYQAFARGNTFHVAPMTVEGLVAFCAEQVCDPGTGDGRARYAADLLRLGEAVPWPPGRNDPCWCRSGRKYKQCCAPVPAKPLPTDTELDSDPGVADGDRGGDGTRRGIDTDSDT